MTTDLFAENAAEIREERSAIAEFDGLLTRAEAEKLGLLESERYRESCEVRHICKMSSREKRADYLAEIEKRRGKESSDRIKSLVQAEWIRAKTEMAGQA